VRVLVTGGAGFIGGHVVDLLRDGHHDVTAMDMLHPAAHRDGRAADGVLIGDVRDDDLMTAMLRDVDVVVHHAAMVGLGVDLDDLPKYVSCNDLGTAVLLAAMARNGIRKLVLASSMVVYGEGAYACAAHGPVRPEPRRPDDLAAGRFDHTCIHCGRSLGVRLVDEDARLDPRSVYAATKLAQEHLAAAWARETGGACAALRYHNVYGPRMPRDTPYAGVAAIFRSTLERGESPQVFEDGRQLRDFVHVHDVAQANLCAIDSLLSGSPGPGTLRAFNVASGEPHTVGDLANALAAAAGGPAPVVTGRCRPGDVRHVAASPARAALDLGFQAKVAFADGIREFARAPLRV
jgi:dTDP-L-rhamnose 4-epimerase